MGVSLAKNEKKGRGNVVDIRGNPNRESSEGRGREDRSEREKEGILMEVSKRERENGDDEQMEGIIPQRDLFTPEIPCLEENKEFLFMY